MVYDIQVWSVAECPALTLNLDTAFSLYTLIRLFLLDQPQRCHCITSCRLKLRCRPRVTINDYRAVVNHVLKSVNSSGDKTNFIDPTAGINRALKHNETRIPFLNMRMFRVIPRKTQYNVCITVECHSNYKVQWEACLNVWTINADWKQDGLNTVKQWTKSGLV